MLRHESWILSDVVAPLLLQELLEGIETIGEQERLAIIVIDDAAGLSWGLVDKRRKVGRIGRVIVDERAVLVEPEQLIRGGDMSIIASHPFKLFTNPTEEFGIRRFNEISDARGS